MVIEKQAQDLENGLVEVAHKIEIYCPNCGRDVDETEVNNKVCNDCGHDLSTPEQHVSVAVTSIPLFGVVF